MALRIQTIFLPVACVLSVACTFGPGSVPECRALDAAVSPTPRNLERLALHVDLSRARARRRDEPLFASDATYARIVRDVYAVRAAIPDVADVTHDAFDDGHSMGLMLSREGMARYHEGRFDDLDCLLDQLDGEIVGVLPGRDDSLEVRFAGVFDLEQVSHRATLELRSVVGAILGNVHRSREGSGPTICVDGTDDDVWHYVFVDTDGWCAKPCTQATSHYVTTTADGDTQLRASYVEAATGPVPGFVRRYRTFTQCGNSAALEGLRR